MNLVENVRVEMNRYNIMVYGVWYVTLSVHTVSFEYKRLLVIQNDVCHVIS